MVIASPMMRNFVLNAVLSCQIFRCPSLLKAQANTLNPNSLTELSSRAINNTILINSTSNIRLASKVINITILIYRISNIRPASEVIGNTTLISSTSSTRPANKAINNTILTRLNMEGFRTCP